MLKIVIPSRSRADARLQRTLENLPDEQLKHTSLMVPASQAKDYAPVAEQFGVDIMTPPSKIASHLGKKRRWAAYEMFDQGHIKLVILDDDVEFYIRENQFTDAADWWKLTTPDDNQLNGMFAQIDANLEHYAHVGVSGREGNNRTREAFVHNTRYMRMLCYNLPELLELTKGGRNRGMDDFDNNLQLLRAGMDSIVWYQYAQGQKGTQTAGGCADWRSLEAHKKDAETLQRNHPKFVTLREKTNKTGGEFGTRTEVTIQWKKARASYDK